ncbi:hypothetical protein [Lysinibacillus capsici]|uniref:hypothetical protein n=1 Tax=Lysinibacillus capsici TaxID=2115968 RepID=UPI0034E3010A
MRGNRPKVYTVTTVVVDNKEYNAIQDNQGFIYTKKQIDELLNSVSDFYNIKNSDEEIARINKHTKLEYTLQNYQEKYSKECEETLEGLFKLPAPIYKYKPFNLDKRSWSCTCNWCNTKVSSEKDDGYFIVNNPIFDISLEHACSEECAELIWKDKVKEWIYDNDYQAFFSL